MIKMIRVDKIFSHPDNPRKNLGDLTELADSIKQSGILQNLTVVPWDSNVSEWGEDEERYTVIIGHRRLAAAKLAGLERVPCAIVNMDKKTQVATMLLENMQRSDLTVYEQAQGFQMMLDLGETVSNISEKTGFSETTVRRRTKLLELDQKKLKETMVHGATLADYARLEKIENLELRNEVLETIGTGDFNYKLKWAIDKEEREKVFAEIIKQLDEFAEKIDNRDELDLSYVKSYYDSPEVTKPKDLETARYFYQVHHSWIGLYREKSVAERNKENKRREREEERMRNKRIALKEVTERAYELRQEFVKKITNTEAKKHMDTIIETMLYTLMEGYISLNNEEIVNIFNMDKGKDVEWEDVADLVPKQPELYLLKTIYYASDYPMQNYYNWEVEYTPNESLDNIYDFLKKLGYQMSEEEIALQNGTHELFKDTEE